jgi:putative transposase
VQLYGLSGQLANHGGARMDVSSHPADDWRIPDKLWEEIQMVLPTRVNTHRFGGGRPRADDRKCMDAIFFVLRTGCQWKALDATGICPGSTAHDRFQEWVEAGVFLEMWRAGLLEYDCLCGLDWAWVSMDGCMTKAPLGGEKDRQKPHRSRQERRQTQPAGRRSGHPGRTRRRRRQSQRHEDGRGHLAKYSPRTTAAYR